MRTPAVQAKQNDSRYRWASRSGNVSAPQSRHNRPPKSNAPPFSWQKSCPRSSFGRFYAPPAAHGRPIWHGWWKFPGLPNICAWSLRPAQNICGLPPIVEVGRGGGAQNRPKLSAGTFSNGTCISNISNPRWNCPPYVFYVPMAYQANKDVKNATPWPEIRPEIRPLRQKMRR